MVSADFSLSDTSGLAEGINADPPTSATAASCARNSCQKSKSLEEGSEEVTGGMLTPAAATAIDLHLPLLRA